MFMGYNEQLWVTLCENHRDLWNQMKRKTILIILSGDKNKHTVDNQ